MRLNILSKKEIFVITPYNDEQEYGSAGRVIVKRFDKNYPCVCAAVNHFIINGSILCDHTGGMISTNNRIPRRPKYVPI